MERRNINIEEIAANTGQIDGLPKNPRTIKDERFKKLVKSIEDAPEMLEYRTLLVMPHDGKFVVVCGNMRYRACKAIGYKVLPCVVLPEDTTPEKLREYAIKDNIGFGDDDWQALKDEWNTEELLDWGVEVNKCEESQKEPKTENLIPFKKNHILISYDIDNHDAVMEIVEKLMNLDVEIETSAN